MGTWNTKGCCGEAVARGVRDVAFVGALIDDVSKKASIDPRRIYVAGFSNGGMLTHRIAAASVVSGTLFGNESTTRAPVLVMHGEQDSAVDFNGGMSQTGFVAKTQTTPLDPVRYAVDFWRRANGCTSAAAVTKQPDVTIERSIGCRGNADVTFYNLPQGGHSWPGSKTSGGIGCSGSGGASAPIDATDVIWTFFQTHMC